jgi:hypothetical protein
MNLFFNISHGHCINANAFASTFYFFAATQINAKKVKRACKPTHQDSSKMDIHSANRQESTTGNSRLASCGVTCLNSNEVLLLGFTGKLTVKRSEIPHERQAANR